MECLFWVLDPQIIQFANTVNMKPGDGDQLANSPLKLGRTIFIDEFDSNLSICPLELKVIKLVFNFVI